MDIQDCIDAIEKLLKENNSNFKNSRVQIVYERGYLTGLLARLMMADPKLRFEILELAKKNTW